ncbi:MAG: DUF805 domain-containing protein [bacterium]
MNYFTDALNKYAVFTGRASRRQYWMFVLVNFLISFAIGLIGGLLKKNSELGFGFTLSDFYNFAMFIPSLAIAVRRMHDVERSGWILLIPIYNLVVACMPGTKGPNKYGADPTETQVMVTK